MNDYADDELDACEFYCDECDEQVASDGACYCDEDEDEDY